MQSLFSAMGVPAGGAEGAGGSMMMTFVTFGLIIVIFYFLIIRPQRKRDKETKNMLGAIKKGDKIQTIGGIRGTVVTVKESSVIIKVDDNARIEFAKNAIATVLDKKPEPAATKAKGEEKQETLTEVTSDDTQKVQNPAKKGKKGKAASEAVDVVVEEVVVEEVPAKEETSSDEKK